MAVKSGLALDEPKWTKYRPERVLQRYDYYKISGDYAFSKVRLQNPDDSKDFRCLIIDEPNLACCWSLSHLNGSADILYNYPRILQAIANGETIFINEGEKACDRMEREGLPATCQRAGADPYAAKWLDIHTAMLAGAKEVVIVADLDPESEHDHMNHVGQRYAGAVCAKLKDARLRARIVTSKTTGDKDDAFDHFEFGFTVADFVARPDLMPASRLSGSFENAFNAKPDPVEFLFGNQIRRGQFTLLSGASGTNKSTMILAVAAAYSGGYDIMGRRTIDKGRTLYFAHEDSVEDYGAMYSINGGVDGGLTFSSLEFALDEACCRDLEDDILGGGFGFVVFDPITDYMGRADLNSRTDVAAIIGRIHQVAMNSRAAIVGIRHTNKRSTWWDKDSGTGSGAFRDKARGHIMMGFNPNRSGNGRGEVVLVPEKGSMFNAPGDPVAFSKNENFTVDWNHVPDMSFLEDDQFKQRLPDFAGGKRQDAEAYLKEALKNGARLISSLLEESGIPYNTMDRASAKLGIIKSKGFNNRSMWELPPYDAFLDTE